MSENTPSAPIPPVDTRFRRQRLRQRIAVVCLVGVACLAGWWIWGGGSVRELLRPALPASRVTVVASSGRTYLAAADSAGHVAVWRGPQREPVAVRLPSQSAITSLQFVGDDWLVAGGLDKSLWAWDLANSRGKQLPSFEAAVTSLMIDPQHTALWVGLANGEIHRVDLKLAEVQRIVALPQGKIKALCWRPGRAEFVVAAADGLLRLYSADGQFIRDWGAHDNEISSVAWHPEGILLASGSWDHTVKIWSLEGNTAPRELSSGVHLEPVAQVGWCAGRVVTVSWDHELRWFAAETGELLQTATFLPESVAFTLAQDPPAVLGLVPPGEWRSFSPPGAP